MGVDTPVRVAGRTSQTADADVTILTPDTDARRATILLYLLRAAAYRIAADCERMLEGLHSPVRRVWRDAVGEALLACRQLLALIPRSDEVSSREEVSQAFTDLSARVQDPQDRIVGAMSSLLRFVPVGAEEELLLHDARTIRETALDLLVFKGHGRGSKAVAVRASGAAPDIVPRDAERPRRVLVVDDDPALRSLLSRMLKKLGYDVILAENGRAALEVAQREQLDLILTDINMPELDGMELLRVLKGDERTRDLPVIVVSSQDDLSSVSTCIEQGAEDHISKPYEPMLLQARVRASLERKRMRDLELDYLRRVGELTAAAEAVDHEIYVPGSLRGIAANDDELGRLARVFDRVTGLISREERLQHRLRRLRQEMAAAGGRADAVAGVSVESPFASAEIVAGRYEIRGELGKGGMGMVYHAHDRELGEDVALKVVRRDLVAADPTLVDRLKSEIRLARRISHRNVVRAHDLGEWNGTYFITMEYVSGITVAELLDRRGRLTVESTLAIGTQMAEALCVAHEQQIIHRDIKPANLLVDNAGVLKVSDFGLARPVEGDVKLTRGSLIVGTPQYMAPEQMMAGVIDARTDLFAVGVVLYECLVGRPPFEGESLVALLAQIVDGAATGIRQVAPDVPPRLESLVHQLIQLEPGNRVTSARELANKLAEIDHATS